MLGIWENDQHSRAVLAQYVRLIRSFGFSGITVLVDKVDETDITRDSYEKTAEFLYPLLANPQVLEIDGLGWAFFLWDKTRAPYSKGKYQIRLDKIANAPITWSSEYLKDLVESRLRFFSEGKVTSMGPLFENSEEAQECLGDAIVLSMNSPRQLVEILDTVLREHDEMHSGDSSVPLMSASSFAKGLDKYAAMYVENRVDRKNMRQLKRLSKIQFVNSDVQSTFSIHPSSARERIKSWQRAGVVDQYGIQRAAGDGGGKPAHEYSITNIPLRRVITRKVALSDEFEAWRELDEDVASSEEGQGEDGGEQKSPGAGAKVFVCYAHADKSTCDEIVKTLAPLHRSGVIEVFWDQDIKPSQKWRDEIEKALRSARVGLLLVSRDFFASDFIGNNELPYLLDQAKNENVKICWVLVGNCLWRDTDISTYQSAYPPDVPLNRLGKHDLEDAVVALCSEIAKMTSE